MSDKRDDTPLERFVEKAKDCVVEGLRSGAIELPGINPEHVHNWFDIFCSSVRSADEWLDLYLSYSVTLTSREGSFPPLEVHTVQPVG